MRMIVNPDVIKPGADLSKIPAFGNGPEDAVFWDSMSRDQVFQFWEYGMKLINDYHDCHGESLGCGILGVLEDTYPDWVEEFEESL